MKIKQQPEDFQVEELADFTPADSGPFYVHRLEKSGIDTFGAIEQIARRFRVDRRSVQVCGLKDRHAKTSQLISLRRSLPEQTDDARWRATFLGRADTPMGADALTGNRFTLVVRHLDADDLAGLDARLDQVRLGLVNYFDSQRFGSARHGQGFMARRLIEGDAEGAVRLFLTATCGADAGRDRRRRCDIGEQWGEWKELGRTLPRCQERPVVQYLAKQPDDWAGAFLKINRQLRAMILFAYQSYIWNAVARRILERDGQVARLADYAVGTHAFFGKPPPDVLERYRALTVPLIKHNSALEGVVAEAVATVLKEEGLTLERFRMDVSEKLFFKEVTRSFLLVPEGLTWEPMGDDPLNKGRQHGRLSFSLAPGSYATLLIKRLFQTRAVSDKPAKAFAAGK